MLSLQARDANKSRKAEALHGHCVHLVLKHKPMLFRWNVQLRSDDVKARDSVCVDINSRLVQQLPLLQSLTSSTPARLDGNDNGVQHKHVLAKIGHTS